MKNLTDLPEGNATEIGEKISCYLAEQIHCRNSIGMLNARINEIENIIALLITKRATAVLKNHGIKAVRIHLV